MAGARRARKVIRLLRVSGIALISLVLLMVIADRAFFQGQGFPPPHLKLTGLLPSSPAREGTWALLINGGVRPDKNYPRYWNNVSLVYGTLKSLGWQKIAVLNADGLSREPDQSGRAFLGMFTSGGGLTDSPTDLDQDGRPDIQGPATKAELARAFADIGRGMRPGDSLFVFITDHGKLAPVDGRLKPIAGLWGDRLAGRELDALLRAHIPESCWAAVLAAQCWGRSFLKDVTRPNTLLIAPGRPNWIWSNQDYSIFPQRFCEALLGKSVVSGNPVRADTDGDGTVSLREAFRSACARDHTPEWPLLWVNGDASAMPEIF